MYLLALLCVLQFSWFNTPRTIIIINLMFILWKLIQSYWYKIFPPIPLKLLFTSRNLSLGINLYYYFNVKSLLHWTPRRQAFAFSGGPLYFPFKGLLENAPL